MSETPNNLFEVPPACPAELAVWLEDSEKSVLSEEPVMSTSVETLSFSESPYRSLIFLEKTIQRRKVYILETSRALETLLANDGLLGSCRQLLVGLHKL